MKGYLVLCVITVLLLCALPPCLIDREPPTEETAVAIEDTFQIQHPDGTVQSLDREQYTRFAVWNLLPTDAPEEAVKAVAAAVYTLGCYQSNTETVSISPIGDYPNTYTDQYWKSVWGEDAYQTHMTRMDELIKVATASPITYQGQPIMAAIHRLNNGVTESAAEMWGEVVPYLVSVESAADTAQPNRFQTKTVSEVDAKTSLESLGLTSLPPSTAWFQNATLTNAGTVKTVQFGEMVLTGTQIQQAFSLPSAAFTASVQEGQVIFTVQGDGHFVGLSLCGCVGMAKDGVSWKEILTHYYTGVTVA